MTMSNIKVSSLLLLKGLLCAIFLLFVAGQIELASAEGSSAAPTMAITFQDQLISAELVDAPLIEVLQRIQKEFGFKAHFHGDLTERITLSFTDMPLLKCLRQLTVNQSLSVASPPTSKELEKNEPKQITEIWVLSRSTTRQAVTIAPTEPVIPAPGDSDGSINTEENSPEQFIDTLQDEDPANQSPQPENGEESSKQ